MSYGKFPGKLTKENVFMRKWDNVLCCRENMEEKKTDQRFPVFCFNFILSGVGFCIIL